VPALQVASTVNVACVPLATVTLSGCSVIVRVNGTVTVSVAVALVTLARRVRNDHRKRRAAVAGCGRGRRIARGYRIADRCSATLPLI